MRVLPLLVLVLVLAPLARALAAEPSVGELVDKAVKALNTTCYEARMNYFAQHAEGEEQTVHIYHVAPDLYHVEVLKRDDHNHWNPKGFYYIENAAELVRVMVNDDDEVVYVEEMPERSFYLNTALACKFLRDLASHPGTVVLDGVVDGIDVYQLRQLAFPEKPYTITVGLDKRNYFPVFLLVNDSDQQARVYYKMEAIEYCDRSELDVALFKRPQVSQKTQKAPRVEQLPANAAVLSPGPENEDGEARIQIQRMAPSKQTTQVVAEPLNYALPPYPEHLPAGYYLEGLHLLDYKAVDADDPNPILVYHFELFNPMASRTMSIFLTRSDEFGSDIDQALSSPDLGYIMQQQGDWLVAVFGDGSTQELQDVAAGLATDAEKVEELLSMTQARDNIVQKLNADD